MTWKKSTAIAAGVVVLLATAAWSSAMRDRSTPDDTPSGPHAWCDGAVERLELMSAAAPVCGSWYGAARCGGVKSAFEGRMRCSCWNRVTQVGVTG